MASVAGFVRRINKLISVQPLKARYNGMLLFILSVIAYIKYTFELKFFICIHYFVNIVATSMLMLIVMYS